MESSITGGSKVGSVREAIEAMARTCGDASFLISPETGRALTFAGLQKQAQAISARLGQARLVRGDKVAFLLDNGLFTVQLFLGTMYGGLVSVPLNVRAGVAQLAYTLDHSDAKVVFVEDQYLSLAREALAGVSRTVEVITADVDAFATDYGAPLGDTSPEPPPAEDIALLMYTSGSVGQPKAAIHSHQTVLAHGRNSMRSHQLTSEDRSLLVLPLYHINAECVTLMPALLSGGSVVVPHQFSVSQFWDWLDEYRCTWSAVVPTIIAQLLDWKDPRADQRKAAFERIRFMRSSSAPLSPSLQREFMEKFPIRLIQAMGSSEAGNIFSNPQAPGENKIGTPGPAWGFETRIISHDGADVATGDPGEVLIRGEAVMQGYYKDADQTAAVLDADAWLHTGDLAYRDQDGYFFVIGRSKELIIKGGVNIAPRQIDEVLESHPMVLEAAVVGVPDHYVGEDLVAFAVLRAGMDGDEREMLAFCENRLGHFKTPTRIHFVADLPKGPSGKVQRLRLLDNVGQPASAGPAHSNGHVGHGALPEGAATVERAIAESWAEVLDYPRVDPDSNFFALGGHSLMAIQCLSRMRDKLAVVLSLSDFFENPTVAQQAALVRQRLSAAGLIGDQATLKQSSLTRELARRQQFEAPAGPEPIPARGRNLPYPLSSGCQRIWFFKDLAPEVPLYNESEAVRLTGELQTEVLEEALNLIIKRHEILRTTIQLAAERPIAIVHESWLLRIKRIDLSSLVPAQREAEVERLLIGEPRLPYNLETEPGIRATLVRLGPTEHVFILMMHHLVCDWASEGVLWRELSSAYRAIARGEPLNASRLPIQYGDYAVWQQQRVGEDGFAEDLAFWEDNLRGAPELLELPSDRPRRSVQTYRGARQRFQLNAALTKAVRNCSRQEKTSLFTVFTAALNTLIYRYTGSEDILLGIPIAERECQELQSVIGFLIHTQALRTRLTGSMTFRELLARVQKGSLALYSRREVPFDQVVNRVRPGRSLSHSPLFQVMINWRDQDQHLSFIGLDGLVVESLLAETRTSKYDLTLFLTDFGSEIWLEAEYSTDLFDDDRIARMFGHYQTLLEAVATDPGQRLSELPLLTGAERHQLLIEWNATDAAYPRDLCIHQLFELQAERTPDAVAVVFGGRKVTYRELNQRANQLAHHLHKLGVGPEVLVAICLERSIEMVVGLLGILKAGGAYVPLDPEYPSERLAFMLADSGAKVLLTQERLLEVLPEHRVQTVCLDREWPQIAQQPPHNPLSTAGSGNLAYVIYTSGSTGKPKGAMNTHGGIRNRLCWMQEEYRLTPSESVLQKTPFSFDVSVWEFFWPLLNGARLVLACPGGHRDSAYLAGIIQEHKITTVHFVPSMLRVFLDEAEVSKCDSLKRIICSGEALPFELQERCLGRLKAALHNLYGPTEASVDVTFFACRLGYEKAIVPIGRPIANTAIYVLDSNLNPVPVGVAGELYIGGAGLGRGYLNRPELTAERFIANPYECAADRLYRTGDVARYLADGNIEYLGRVDYQVKLRGFRIELGEIEVALSTHGAVKQAVVLARAEDHGEQGLAAYVVSANRQHAPSADELRYYLKEQLPEYMIPAAFVMMDALPLLPNGKIDRKALPAPESDPSRSEESYVAPRTPVEESLAAIWRNALGLKQIGIHDDFFALGGHSLQATQLLSRVHKALGQKLSVALFFHDPTIAGMARVIEEEIGGKSENQLMPSNSYVVPIRPEGSTPPLFLIHGVGGKILGFLELTTHLELGQRLYGIEYVISHSAPPMLRLEDLAARYIEDIRKVQPDGPYYLLGYSFGGILAFEMAQQLNAMGQAIGILGMVDSHPILMNGVEGQEAPHGLIRVAKRRIQALNLQAQRILRGPARLRYLRDQWSIKAGNLAARVRSLIYAALTAGGRPIPKVLEHAYAVNWFAASRYQARPYPGRITLFRAASGEPDVDERYGYERGWKPLAGGGVEVHEISGTHLDIIHEPNVRSLSHQLTACLSLCYGEPRPRRTSFSHRARQRCLRKDLN